MDIKTFGVIGSGQMGNGIAQVAAASGLNVIMNDINTEFVERGLNTISKNLARSVEKGKLSDADKNAILGRIKASVALKDMAAADFVVEAATENEKIKILAKLNLTVGYWFDIMMGRDVDSYRHSRDIFPSGD